MVWARTKLSIWDYVFEPVKEINIKLSAKKPENFYKQTRILMQYVLNIPESYVQEKSFEWQPTDNGANFNVKWEASKLFDKFTYLNLELTLKGSSKEGKGKISVRIQPKLITEYPQDTLWQQSIFYEMIRRFWHTFFYHKKRMEYLDISKDLTVKLEQSLKQYAEKLNKG